MENTTELPVLGKKGTFPATVAKVIDDYKLVINKGELDGIREGQRMLVYSETGEQIIDPNTGEFLGILELVKGTGKIFFVQEKYSILESDKTKSPSLRQFVKNLEQDLELKIFPFDKPNIGDKVKPI